MSSSKKELRLYSAVVGSPHSPVGKWRNELDSVLDILEVDHGRLIGKYASAVSTEEHPVKGEVTGYINGDTISFVVNWAPTFKSVTCFAGKILATETGEPYIYTLWQLSRGVENTADWWQSFLSGSDTFWRVH